MRRSRGTHVLVWTSEAADDDGGMILGARRCLPALDALRDTVTRV